MRGEGNDFVDSELEQACNRAAGRTKSRVLPEGIAASLQPMTWPRASVAIFVLANLSRSTFQSPAATQLGMR